MAMTLVERELVSVSVTDNSTLLLIYSASFFPMALLKYV